MGTIYKHMLMGNKKGDLGHVWMAAHFPHRIRKEFVEQTNISSAVDKILVDQLPVVTYRILGFLLLGITRLYSKKVEYLLVDCNHSLYEMKVYTQGRKKVNINLGGLCTPESSSQRSKTNIVDTDLPESSSRKKSNTFMDVMRAEFSSISLPENFELDAFDLQVVEDDSSNEHHVKSHLEIVLPDAWGNDQTGHNLETSPENLRSRFSLEDCIVPMDLDEEIILPKIPFIEQDPEWNNNTNTNTRDNFMTFEDRNDKECTTGDTMVLETTTLIDDNNNTMIVKPSPQKLSVTVDVTPRSKGVNKSDNMVVRTPAVKERVRVSKKRKCAFDDVTVVRNLVYKEWVTDASDLLRERKKAPYATSFDYFMDPIIPINAGFPSDFRSVISTIKLLHAEEQTMEPVLEVAILHHRSSEEELIAPLTPIATQSTSKANHEGEGPTSSCESGEKDMFPFPNNDEGLDSVQSVSKQGPSSSNVQNQGLENWSALTKSVGGYLHSKKDKVVKLSEILKQKTKRESARVFSEILVLKSGGYIDVKQNKAYDEIFVMQTFKLKEVFGS